MQTKVVIRIVFFALILTVLVLAGMYAFVKLRTGEQVYHTDLFELVPQEHDVVFFTPEPNKLTQTFPKELLPDSSYLSIVDGMRPVFTKSLPGSDKFILSFKKNDGLILYPSTPEQIAEWESLQNKKGFFIYPPVKDNHAEINYTAYLTNDGRFFCFSYHQGVFLASYSKLVLEKALDLFTTGEKAIDNPSFAKAKESISNTSPLRCFFKEQKQWYGFDLTLNKEKQWLNGFIKTSFLQQGKIGRLPEAIANSRLQTQFIPSTTSALVFLDTDTSLFSQPSGIDLLMKRQATGNTSISYYSSIDTLDRYFRTTCFELRNRYAFLKELNALLSASSFTSRNYVWHYKEDYIVYKIYQLPENVRLSGCLGMLSREEDTFFTFYQNNLLISDSEEALLQYWKQVHTRQVLTGEEPLLQPYRSTRSEEANLFVSIAADSTWVHPLAQKEWIPSTFRNRHFGSLFLQFIPGDDVLLYNGFLF